MEKEQTEFQILITDASTSEVTLAVLPCNKGEDVSETVSLYFNQIDVRESEADWMEVPLEWTSKDIHTGPLMLAEEDVVERLPFLCKECGYKEFVKEVAETTINRGNITNVVRALNDDYPRYEMNSGEAPTHKELISFKCKNCNTIIAHDEINLVQALRERHCPPKPPKQTKGLELPVKVFHCSACMDGDRGTEGCFTLDVPEHMHKAESPCLDGTWEAEETKPDFKEIDQIPKYILMQVINDLGTHEASGTYITEYVNSLISAIHKGVLDISHIPSVGVFNDVKQYLKDSRFHFHLGADDFFKELNKRCHEFKAVEL